MQIADGSVTGFIADNVVGFARALRLAGVPAGPGAVIDALNALKLIEVGQRGDVFTALQSVFVKRHEHAILFKQAFELFFRVDEEWKNLLDSIPLPDHAQKPPPPGSRRVQEALTQSELKETEAGEDRQVQLSVSDREVLQTKDFAQMTAAEIANAKQAIAKMTLPLSEIETRRHAPDPRGHKIDLRRTMRASLRTGGDIVEMRRLGRIDKPVPIVALLDISGSMSEYTRLFLHFLHAVTDARKRVAVFAFGTRLTNLTRSLRARDPDEALAACSSAVEDWSGGTRIATSLHTFNKLWSRRVLGQGATVLLISDGLERDVDQRLSFEMDRLHRSCRRLVWLNPLLRYGGFEAKAQGIKLMLPHVDEFRPIHNLKSIQGLITALSSDARPQRRLERTAA